MDPHSPTGAGGGCKRAGATGTSRLCEAPGGPCFSEKPRTESPEWLEGQSRGRGPRWCPPPPPPGPPPSLSLEREETGGSVEESQTSGPGNSSTDACTQEGLRRWRKERGLGAPRREGCLQAQGKLGQGLRTRRDWGKGGSLWKSMGTGTSKGKSIFSPGVGTE